MQKPKPDIGKKLNRHFFRVFNDKSKPKQFVFWGLLAVAPAMYLSEELKEDPSDIRAVPVTAAEEMQAFEKEIETLGQLTGLPDPGQKPTPQEIEKTVQAKVRAADFSVRVMSNTNISEKDIGYLAAKYTDAVGKNIPLQNFQLMARSSKFVDECRRAGNTQGLSPETAANTLMDCTVEAYSNEYWKYGIGAYIGLFMTFELATNILLRIVRRRDDENIEEEKKENFIAAKEDLEDFLKPKSPPRKPGV